MKHLLKQSNPSTSRTKRSKVGGSRESRFGARSSKPMSSSGMDSSGVSEGFQRRLKTRLEKGASRVVKSKKAVMEDNFKERRVNKPNRLVTETTTEKIS